MRSSRPVLSSAKSAFIKTSSLPRLIAQALYVVSIVLFCVVIWVTPIQASPQQAPAAAAGPDSIEGVTVQMEPVTPYEFRGDLRNLPQVLPSNATRQRPALPVRHAPPSNKNAAAPVVGQQEQPSANLVLPLAPAPSPTQNFPGMSSNDTCTGGPCGGAVPPDPNGEVGPNHYIEAVNSGYAIYSKTGTQMAAFTEDSLWSASGSSSPCGNGNAAGDPIVVYDPLGNRWILAHIGSAFSNPTTPAPPFYECIAVSKTSDPVTGGWWLYPLQMDPGGAGAPPSGTFNDYPKFGIWPDCLYMSANGFSGTGFTGAMYASMSRSDLENGTTPLTWSLGFINNANDPFTMIPSNLRGTPPPAGTPNYFVSESQSQTTPFFFEVRKFTPGPNCGGGGTLSTATNVSQTPYASAPLVVVPQPNTSQLLDAVDDRLMQKVQYRRVGNAESLWVVHNVGVSSGLIQPQWAQIDVTGGAIAATPVQQQIYAPDMTLNRWMGSIAADRQGNVALGYSTSNGTAPNFPSIAYSGRLVTDPPNTLPQTEVQLVAGQGSQMGIERWGDYTGMSVDPSDDCTFWYVNEYYSSPANGANNFWNWQTQISSFKFPSCTSGPAVTLTPSSVPFSNQLVGTTSPTTNVQLTNSGSATLNITSIALAGTDSSQFALVAPTSGSPACFLTASSINASSSCFFGVQFKPTSAGSKSANVSVTDDASGSPQTVALTGPGVQPIPAVTLTPANVPFNNQPVGTTSPTTNLQITNSGGATLNITSITLAGTDSSQFALVAPTSGSPACSLTASSINAGSSCFFGVQFKPTSAGSKSANVSVTDDASGSPQSVGLTGTGTVVSPAVSLSPAIVSFNNQAVGTTSGTTNLQVTNSGTSTLNITSITLTGTYVSQFLLVAPTSGSACSLGASSLNAGSSCFVGVQFKPTSPGSKSASVSVADNASGSPQTVSLSGTGAGPAVTLSSTNVQFNNQAVGTMSAITNLQITSTGSTPLNIMSITLSGADYTQFVMVPPTSGSPCVIGVSTLNPNSSCFIGLQFRPTSAGAKSVNVNIIDNASDSPQPVALSGTGVAPAVTLSQVSVAFGDINLGLSSATSNIQVTNSGNLALNLTSITLAGTDAAHFALVAPTAGSPACAGTNSLSAASSCFVGVQFKPTGVGNRNANINVIDNAPTTTQIISLSGTGVDFSVAAAPPTTATVAAGSNASFTINLTTTGGPTQSATMFSASGNPTDTTVAFSTQPMPAGTATSSTMMTITTVRRSNAWPSARPFPARPGPASLLYSILCLTLGSALLFLKRKWLKENKLIGVCSLGVVLLACAAFQGCARTQVVGGNGTPGSTGTPAGTSTITVSATAGTLSRMTTVSLTVQ